MSRVSIRVFGDTLELVRRGDERGLGGTSMSPAEAAWAIETQAGDALGRDPMAIRELARLIGQSASTAGFSFPGQGIRVRSAVADALRSGRLLAFRSARPTVVENRTVVEPLGWEQSEDDDDLYVIAVAIKHLGDTPVMRQAVRVLHPKTGEVVVDGLTTDDEGIVRALVPEQLKYRIEIVDVEDPWPHPPIAEDRHALLRCLFVDMHGVPVAHEEVSAQIEDETMALETDEDGRIDVPATLGHYTLTVREQTFDAHAVLARDGDDETSFYHFVVEADDDDDDSTDGDHRLPRVGDEWDHSDDPSAHEIDDDEDLLDGETGALPA